MAIERGSELVTSTRGTHSRTSTKSTRRGGRPSGETRRGCYQTAGGHHSEAEIDTLSSVAASTAGVKINDCLRCDNRTRWPTEPSRGRQCNHLLACAFLVTRRLFLVWYVFSGSFRGRRDSRNVRIAVLSKFLNRRSEERR